MSASELENYKLQLQQVEAALMAEPENEELQKLKEVGSIWWPFHPSGSETKSF
jgi:hypothetical protein